MKTAMEQLLHYVKTTNSFTFLPEQLAKVIEDEYMPKSIRDIKTAFNDGEANVWDRERDGGIFEYEDGLDYYTKTYINETDSK
jgi:hypothetical protein